MKTLNIILISLNSLALLGAIVWIFKNPDFEPVITSCVLLIALIGQVIKYSKKSNEGDKRQEKLLDHLEKLTHNFTQEKQLRATRFLEQSGYGNEKYKSFIEFAFDNIEKGIIEFFKSKDFDDLCKVNNIVIQVLTEKPFLEFWLNGEGKRVDKTNLVWTGNGIFSPQGEPSLGAFMKDKRLVVTQKALDDFRRIHDIFIAYVENAIPEEELHQGVTPEGMVPPNY